MDGPVTEVAGQLLAVRLTIGRIHELLGQIEHEMLASTNESMDGIDRYAMMQAGDQVGMAVTIAEAACEKWLGTATTAFRRRH